MPINRSTWILGLVLLLSACGPAASPSASGHTLTGTLTLGSTDGVLQKPQGKCEGQRGYDDITAAAQVTVKDQTGTIIATTNLGEGARGPATSTHLESAVCTFSFSFAGVPDATFYTIEASHRGELTYSKAEMEANGWSVAFTLGD